MIFIEQPGSGLLEIIKKDRTNVIYLSYEAFRMA